MDGGSLNLDIVRIDPSWALRVPSSLAVRRRVLPLCRLEDHIVVACADSIDPGLNALLTKYLGREIKTFPAELGSLKRSLQRVYGSNSKTMIDSRTEAASGRDAAEDAVVICEELLHAAYLRDASDIHLLPQETNVLVEFRVDGLLETYRTLPLDLHLAVNSRFKVMAGLDIAEKRAPQDGRFTADIGALKHRVDIRVASLPTRHGERMTLRLLATRDRPITLSTLGMSDQDLTIFRRSIEIPHGLILLTGPTGSGKTTTLYAAMEALLAERRYNVVTVEDPIEYEIKNVSQVEVDSADKVSFNRALRSILRHDPDVIMIGEIRDSETANLAVKAALTGHLVFSTLHTNTAAGVVTRLLDMGVDRYLVAATLRLAVAQRLVRRLCPSCATEEQIGAERALALCKPDMEASASFRSTGCVYCAGRGYSGRIGLFEMFDCSHEVSSSISKGASEADLILGMKERQRGQLMDDALAKINCGLTSVDEIIKAVVAI